MVGKTGRPVCPVESGIGPEARLYQVRHLRQASLGVSAKGESPTTFSQSVTIPHIAEHRKQYLPSHRICFNGFMVPLMRECGQNVQNGHLGEMTSSRLWNFH
jgi:hypothetical protein